MSPGGLVTAALQRDVSMLGDNPKEALVPYCSEGWGPVCKPRPHSNQSGPHRKLVYEIQKKQPILSDLDGAFNVCTTTKKGYEVEKTVFEGLSA